MANPNPNPNPNPNRNPNPNPNQVPWQGRWRSVREREQRVDARHALSRRLRAGRPPRQPALLLLLQGA